MKTSELFGLLAKQYPSPQYAFLGNVRNTTGFVKDIRTADALALGLWPSRGMYLTGFELKVSRSDWMHECKNPEKAEAICQFCDYWYLVVADEAIVSLTELPKNWGMMAIIKGKLKVIKEAPLLKPIPIDRPFLAGFLRNISENYINKISIEDKLKEAEQSGIDQAEYKSQSIQRDYNKLFDTVKKFETASGVIIENWNVESIGEAVRMVLKGEHLTVKENLIRIRDKINQALEN